LRQAMGDYTPTMQGTWKEAVVKYGKGNNVKATDILNGTASHHNEEIFVSVRGVGVPLSSAEEWRRSGKQPEGLRESGSINMSLVRRRPDGSFEPVKFDNEVTLEEALEWLDKY